MFFKYLVGRLTRQDIREFVYGSDRTTAVCDAAQTEENANNMPYNRKYELTESQICVGNCL